jgi:hypothetical protein
MSAAKPIWLLDFDGVLNILAAQGDTSVWAEWRDHKRPSPEDIPWMLWAPEAVSLVAEANEAGVRVVWLTTWGALTATIADVIKDIPADLEYWTNGDLSRIGHTSRRSGQNWKVDCARFLVPEQSPLLWTDDNLPKMLHKDDRAWLRSREPETLTIAPRKEIGLTPKHAARIRDWIGKVT